ncbi:MAG: 1-(5-phosphoribosyl)-5-[(5-phosphoribosylamino)methylideneamino]imidazole-4-carboxamide isomerase [Hyphomicrobiales bacterium]
MILFPAIDLKDGRCVRLKQGDMAAAQVYNDDPVAQARLFQEAGFEWLHIVDLNGAFSGKAENEPHVRAILAAVSLPIQLGGGIRTLSDIERWLGLGVRRVILGTVAVRDPALVKEACRSFPGRIVVGVDARDGLVAVEGWATASTMRVKDLAALYADAGVAALVYTDIARDGILAGVNVESTLDLARATPIPVIASGGLASMADIDRLCAPECAILEGVISGRALYDGRIDAADALRRLAAARPGASVC